jgi:hypothetical protein
MLPWDTVAQVSFLIRVNAGAVIWRSEVCREAFFNGRCRGKAGWFLLAAFSIFSVAARAADPSLSLAPPPDWVAPLAFQRLSRPEDLNAGLASRLLLSDFQVNTRTRETFQHEARQLLTRAGVEDGSHLHIDFDSSQSLVFHWVRIWRGPNTFNELDLDRISVIQPERDPDRFLFAGGKTALLLLEDARAGDIVEYACTIRGEDPAGGGKMSGAVLLRHFEPVERLAARLICPRERRLYLKNHGTDAKPSAVRKEDLTEYTWDYKKVPGLRGESLLPAGYEPLPWVQWSEYAQWSEVNQWALTIFTNALPLAPELTRQIKDWKRLPGAEERMLAVLRFVQDEVGYHGIGTGAETYQAADPALVFARRFGDCKDKTLLCVTLLRALGIEANPVLVSAELGQTIQDWHPTATVFDHAIVQAVVDGRNYWLDPTAGFQRGPLAARSWPNYGRGLAVRPKTTALAVIPECPVQPKTTVLESVFIRFLGQPADLKVVTIADGADAERMRRRFSTPDRAVLADEDLNAFAALYPGIVRMAPREYSDDARANEVVVTDYYQIGNMWSPVPAGPGYVCWFYSYNVDRAVRKPAGPARSMPLGLSYPEHQVFRVEFTVPLSLRMDPGRWTIDNPAFHFHKTVAVSPGKVVVEHEYDALADRVPVEAMPGYLLQLDQASGLLGYALYSY